MLNERCKKILESREAPATVVLIVAIDALGKDLLTWDPGTIQQEMDDLLGKPMPTEAFNRLMAGIELVNTNGFYKDLPTFIRLCHALVSGILIVDEFIPADAVDVAIGITEALIIWPPDQKDNDPFCDQITGYIGEVLKDEGILQPPDVLRLGGGSEMWQKVQMGFSDDPAMFNAIYNVEKSKTDEINDAVKSHLRKVMELLDQLPLNVGDAENAVKRMFSALGRERQSGQEMKPNVGAPT
jgi:hypothetical protein